MTIIQKGPDVFPTGIVRRAGGDLEPLPDATDYYATAHTLASDLGFAGDALHQSRIRKEIAAALAEAAADMRERCVAIIQRHTEMANAEVAHTLTIVADAIAESAEATSRSGHAELVAAMEKIALRKPWLGRETYSRDDEGLLEYWSDLAKEFQAIARAALAAGGHTQKEPNPGQRTILIASHEAMMETLEGFVEWSEAYPTNIFPEPDLRKAHDLLKAGGMTLDAISAHIMRETIGRIGERARAALTASLRSTDSV